MKNNRFYIFGIFLWIVLYSYVLFQFEPYLSYFFHSDTLYSINILQSIHNFGDYKNWSIAPAPYFFYDFFLYLILFIISKNSIFISVCYVWIQFGFISFLLQKFLLKSELVLSNNQFKVFSLLLFIISFLFLIFPEFNFLVTPVHHFSAYTISILLFLFLNSINESKNRLMTFTFFIVFLLTAISDSLFFVFGVMPAIITFLMFDHSNKRKILLFSFSLIVLSFYIMNKIKSNSFFIIPTHYIKIDFINFLELKYIFTDHSLFQLLINFKIHYLLFSFFIAYYLLNKLQNESKKYYFFLMISGFINYFIILFYFIFRREIFLMDRYLIGFYSFIFLSILILINRSNRTLKILILSLLFIFAGYKLVHSEIKKTNTWDKLSCIEKALGEKRFGLGMFWKTRPVLASSNGKILPNDVFQNLEIAYWLNSMSIYEKNHPRTEYEWILMEGMDETQVKKWLGGDPTNIQNCNESVIWFYPKESFDELKKHHFEQIILWKKFTGRN